MEYIAINKIYEFIKNYNPEQLPYTELDCDGNCDIDMEKFAEEVKQFAENNL